MRDGLTPGQRSLAREVALRQGASVEVLNALDRGELVGDACVALGDLATTDLAERGFGANYEPTSVGRELEDLIDVLNDLEA